MKLSAFESNQIYRENMVWLLAAQAAAIVPLLRFLPLWITAVWLISLLWRLLIYRGRINYPGLGLKLAFAIAFLIGIYFSYAGQISAEPMVAFLVCSFVMKVIEMRSRKDALVVLFICFIAISTQFLFAQDILAGLYGFLSLLVLVSAWTSIFRSAKLSVWQHLYSGGRMVVYSLPMMLVLFIIMPRLGPLWTVPLPDNQGAMGFGESIQLGDVGKLVRSPEIAFRAKFNGAWPAPRELYWRGLVLDSFDGYRWSADDIDAALVVNQSLIKPQPNQRKKPDLDYSVILEPHQYRWLFAVGWPVYAQSAQVNVESNLHGILFSDKPVFQKIEYHVKASKFARYKELPSDTRKINLRLPADHNPRAAEMAESWKQEGLEGYSLVSKALSYFANDFSYTLRVDQVKVNAIDYFLFESKRGFCEHFASSFVFLMRSAGIPARIVIGYQGGELNQVDRYYIVRQSDAHAWAEVWLEGQGWIKIDPTGMVAPDRIEVGVDEALDSEDRKLLASNWDNKFYRRLAHHWDSMSYSWNHWVLNFDNSKQEGILTWLLGSADPLRVGLAIVLMSSLVILPMVTLHHLRSRMRFKYKENRIVSPLLNKLHKQGVGKRTAESVSAYLCRVAGLYPKAEGDLRKLAVCYQNSCYNTEQDPELLKRLVSRCRRQIQVRNTQNRS